MTILWKPGITGLYGDVNVKHDRVASHILSSNSMVFQGFSTPSVKLLGVYNDDKLNFNEHINKICKSAGNQLNALIRLKSFLGLKEKEVLVNSFIYSNFNYCPFVWMLSHKK